MRTKLISTALCCAAVMAFGIGADAAEEIKFYESILSGGEYVFVVEGYVPSGKPEENVNIMIFNPGYDLNGSMGMFTKEVLQYQDSVETAQNGYFKIEIPIYLDGINDSGEYSCYVGGEGFDKAQVLAPVYFASIDDRKQTIKKLKNAADVSEISALLGEAEKNLSLDDELYRAIDKDKFAALLFENKDRLDEEKTAESAKLIKTITLVEAYNEGQENFVYKNGEFLYTNLLDFSAEDKAGIDLYKTGYKQILNDNGKKYVIGALLENKNFRSEKDLVKAFHENVMLYAIKNHAQNGNGHVEKLLTAENAAACGMNIPTYLALGSDSMRSKAADIIMSKSFAGISELQAVVEAAAKKAKTPSTNGGGSTGGSYGSSKSDSSTIVIGNENITADDMKGESKEVFADLENVSWAKEAIYYLYEKNIVSGVAEDRFAPQSNVTREQFAVMLIRAFSIETTQDGGTFEDVVPGSYYEKYVNTAKKLGIVNGISESMFGVGKKLSRQDMTVMIKNAADYSKRALAEKNEMIEFSDTEQIAEYARTSVTALVKAGVINEFSDNTFRPSDSCTRAQAAKMIYELMKGADV